MFSLSAFLITFRESLEAALIIGIILAYLKQIKATKYNNVVYLGVGGGLLSALILAYLFETYFGGFTGKSEAIFEGVIMLFAAFLITLMILWMKKQKAISAKLRAQLDKHVEKAYPLGIFLLTFLSVGREGIETVIFLNASTFADAGNPFWSGIIGVVLAIGLGYIIFATAKRVPLKHFFNVTSILLIFFAAGLAAHGIHELQEAQVIPFLVEEVWNLNPEVVTEGVYPIWHDKGTIGSFLKALFGYNGNPSLIEVLTYVTYLAGIGYLFGRKPKTKTS